MDLLPPKLRADIARYPFGSQERLGENAKVLVKFFFPASRYTYFVTEAQEDDDDVGFFGYCVSALGDDCDEWGYASLAEFAKVTLRGLMMERDLDVPFARYTVRELLARAA